MPGAALRTRWHCVDLAARQSRKHQEGRTCGCPYPRQAISPGRAWDFSRPLQVLSVETRISSSPDGKRSVLRSQPRRHRGLCPGCVPRCRRAPAPQPQSLPSALAAHEHTPMQHREFYSRHQTAARRKSNLAATAPLRPSWGPFLLSPSAASLRCSPPEPTGCLGQALRAPRSPRAPSEHPGIWSQGLADGHGTLTAKLHASQSSDPQNCDRTGVEHQSVHLQGVFITL